MGKPQGYVLVIEIVLQGKPHIFESWSVYAIIIVLFVGAYFLYIHLKAFPVLYLFGKTSPPLPH